MTGRRFFPLETCVYYLIANTFRLVAVVPLGVAGKNTPNTSAGATSLEEGKKKKERRRRKVPSTHVLPRREEGGEEEKKVGMRDEREALTTTHRSDRGTERALLS